MDTAELKADQIVDFFVVGTPKPQGSKRAFHHPHTKRIIMTEAAGAKLKDWRYDVKSTAAVEMSRAGHPIVMQPTAVRLTIAFVMPRPVSTPKTRATPLAVKKPDLDKLVRAVCDALTGVVYNDDSQVIAMMPTKRIAEIGESPGAHITVEALDLNSAP